MRFTSRLGAEEHLQSAHRHGGYGFFCPNCRQTVEMKNDICPVCGFKLASRPPVWKTVLFYSGAILILLFIASVIIFLLWS